VQAGCKHLLQRQEKVLDLRHRLFLFNVRHALFLYDPVFQIRVHRTSE
jgi:hypothetical protein